jgi:hypothetical protein
MVAHLSIAAQIESNEIVYSALLNKEVNPPNRSEV